MSARNPIKCPICAKSSRVSTLRKTSVVRSAPVPVSTIIWRVGEALRVPFRDDVLVVAGP